MDQREAKASAAAPRHSRLPRIPMARRVEPAGSFFRPFFLNGASFVKPVGAAPESRSCVSLLTLARYACRWPACKAVFPGLMRSGW